jgi:hypothetical protein
MQDATTWRSEETENTKLSGITSELYEGKDHSPKGP